MYVTWSVLVNYLKQQMYLKLQSTNCNKENDNIKVLRKDFIEKYVNLISISYTYIAVISIKMITKWVLFRLKVFELFSKIWTVISSSTEIYFKTL